MATPSHLSGKVALVTGGSKGIGAAIAQALAHAGAAVASTSRSGSGPTAPNLIQLRSDVRKPEDAQRAVGETVRAFGGLDILVNNAGVGAFAKVADMSIEQWHDVIDTNLSGVFYCCHAAIPEIRKRGGGLDHQHQQPRRQERVRRGRRLLRVQGRPEPLQRGA